MIRHMYTGNSKYFGTKLLQGYTQTKYTGKMRPMIEIPLTSFTIKTADTGSEFDYEISPAS